MKKYKLLIQIGHRQYNHNEKAESEYNARNKTIDAAMTKFGVKREEVKIIECQLVEENKEDNSTVEKLKNIFGIK